MVLKLHYQNRGNIHAKKHDQMCCSQVSVQISFNAGKQNFKNTTNIISVITTKVVMANSGNLY